jgi:hypothetical protein
VFDYFRTHPSCPEALQYLAYFSANEHSVRTKSRASSLANIISPQVLAKAKNTWSQCEKSPAPNSRVNKILIFGRGQEAVSFDGKFSARSMLFLNSARVGAALSRRRSHIEMETEAKVSPGGGKARVLQNYIPRARSLSLSSHVSARENAGCERRG